MSRRRMWFRLRASLLAVGIGWAAAMAATVPMVLWRLWSDAIGSRRQMLWSLAAGTGIWFGWTLAIVAAAWLLGGLPVAAIVSEDWLMRHRSRAIAISVAAAIAVLVGKFQLWKVVLKDYWTEPWLLSLYALLVLVFATTSTAAYLRLVARSRGSEMNPSLR